MKKSEKKQSEITMKRLRELGVKKIEAESWILDDMEFR
jgi:hypothetical protein